MLSIATMYWPPNVDSMLYFHDEIWPLVKAQCPIACSPLPVRSPCRPFRRLLRTRMCASPATCLIRETSPGYCSVFIVPLRSGSGVRVKLLNAMAMGLPIVSTSIGAEGLDVVSGEHLLIADTPGEFAEAVVGLINDRELGRRLGENARALVCEKYSWETVGARLLDVYEGADGIVTLPCEYSLSRHTFRQESAVRPFQIIKGLAQRHEVHVLALGGSDKADAEGVEETMAAAKSFSVVPHGKLRGYFQSLIALPTPHPMCTAFCWSRAMSKIVQDSLRNLDFDIVHVEHLRAAHFAPIGGRAPVVCDAVDCLTGSLQADGGRREMLWLRCLMREEAWKLARYRGSRAPRFASVMVTSSSERSELQRLDAGLSVQVVPNGVDTDYFAPTEIEKHPRRVVFSGKMSYHPNAQAAVWFGENVFPATGKATAGCGICNRGERAAARDHAAWSDSRNQRHRLCG